ncbi:RraA family protein [Actinomycetospora straminea]|uniref:Putative 4-hydroxy-4-methyl-2-oxoglutarate aldolase n=1 Tax=Actinomycetospora straminea TaxID=663607 RepID=A0ABP9F265_9PSEU|nr:RraA family protein [Actinomycetospora straminea]MDD7934715.1 RraA family protein [Actinomycetospora straminea]
MDPLTPDELGRVRSLATSSLCDADKTFALPDPAIRAMVPDVRMAGPAVTVVAPDDHLPVLAAAGEAPVGSVLVVVNPRGTRAVAGELIASEARRRGLAGMVIDGYCRDVAGLRRIGLPVFARGTTPASGSARDPRGRDEGPVALGGVPVRPGDLVLGDDDGLAIATPDQVRAALAGAEEVERAEAAVLAGMAEGRGGRSLADHTNLADHRAARAAGQDSWLRFLV